MYRWPLLLAAGCLLSLVIGSDPIVIKRGVKKTRKAPVVLRDWDHNNDAVCSGTYNGRTLAGNEDRIGDLRNMYENCTRVRGNLEITHLTAEHLKSNETLKERLKIFQHIEEIKGYLLIYNVDMEVLKFPNLRIIWGDEHFEDHSRTEGAALVIAGNQHLKEISMPKLRTINSGDVLIENNTFLCFMRDKVNWNELLNMQSKSRLLLRPDSFRQCAPEEADIYKCHSNCTSGHCWGQSTSQCQELYRTPCPHCSSGQCYFSQDEGEYKCCHMTCEGGCSGPKDSDCIACKELKLNNSCVSKCPPIKILDKKLARKVYNPDGYYMDDRYCVKQCPVQMLIEDETCVRHCSEGYFHDMTKDTRMCEPCQNGRCAAKACEVNSPLTGSILANLTGCEIINGFLRIQGPRMKATMDGYSVADLNVLRSVRVVSEYVSIVGGEVSPSNLSFLENLEIIEGRDLDTKRYALVISKNDNLRELGLRRLRKIKAGNVFIRENLQLCFASTVNWNESLISSAGETNIGRNMQETTCVRRKKVCHKECDQEAGCWGQGDRMCVRCSSWKMKNESCVRDCPSQGFYKEEETKECLPCYDQCLECAGPKAEDCLSCRRLSLWKEDQLTCLEECPLSHFLDGDRCLPCHESCFDFGCTGPRNILGNGGCNKCKFGFLNEEGEIAKCLFTEGPQSHVCEANNLTHHYVSTAPIEGVELVHCSECDDQCESCTSAGRGVEINGCRCRNYIVESHSGKRLCSGGCFDFSYEAQPKSGEEPGLCIRCSDVCDHNGGCNGPLPSDCHQCANASIFINDTKTCVAFCPENLPFLATVNDEKICADKDLDAIQKRRQKFMYLGIFIVCFVVVIGFLIVIWKCRRVSRTLEKVQIENLADIPEMMSVTAVRPNLNKVNLISANELQNKCIKLGSGAFGVVYAGYWFPKGGGPKKVPVAIKVVKASGKIRGEEEGRMLEEAGRMAQLRHQHLIRLVGVCLRDDGLELVTLLRPLGDLLSWVRKHKEKLLGKDLLLYCYQISSAMKYLYEHKLVHRDLAARNVLVKKINHVEVTDFGLSKFIAYGEHEVMVSGGKVAFKWIAPECCSNYIYTHQTDVWSYGVTCWEILTFGQSPYQGMDIPSIKNFLHDGNRLEQPNNCSIALYQILLSCWLVNPDSRPTFVTLYERLKEFCKTPSVYVADSDSVINSPWNDTEIDQAKELRELLADESECWDDVEDPLNYFDTEALDTDSLTGAPMARNVRRATSTSSHRYQTDPMSRPNLLSNKSLSIGIEDSNYLVPDSKLSEHQAILYTPVVVNEHGHTELVEMNEYYNDPTKPSCSSSENEYYNDLSSREKSTAGALIKIQEESEEVEKESCL